MPKRKRQKLRASAPANCRRETPERASVRTNVFNAVLAEIRLRRSAPGVSVAWSRKRRNSLERGSGSEREPSAKPRRRYRQRMRRHQHRKRGSVIERAGSGAEKLGVGSMPGRPHGHQLGVHRAVVRPVPPATGRQAGILAAVDQGRQRTQPEEQDQENGEAAPHLHFMLADSLRRESRAVTRNDEFVAHRWFVKGERARCLPVA